MLSINFEGLFGSNLFQLTLPVMSFKNRASAFKGINLRSIISNAIFKLWQPYHTFLYNAWQKWRHLETMAQVPMLTSRLGLSSYYVPFPKWACAYHVTLYRNKKDHISRSGLVVGEWSSAMCFLTFLSRRSLNPKRKKLNI